MRILVTGAAGFIGFHLARTLLDQGHDVLGYDNVNDYYDPLHKHARLKVLHAVSRFSFVRGNLEDAKTLEAAWVKWEPEIVVHLAAQAGVRYSMENPHAYIQSNIVGFQNVIELVRHRKPRNFLYASSSSVYGGNKKLPFSEDQDTRTPLSLYAATKMSNELVAKTYAHLYDLPSTGFRFFTVYGPYSRPDMALFKFSDLMRHGKPITVYNHGQMIRDFTFVDDIVSGLIKAIDRPVRGEVYNLGRGKQIVLLDAIKMLEEALGIKAIMEFAPIHAGDVEATIADVSKAARDFNYSPKVEFKDGVKIFAEWYLRSFLKT